MPKPTTNDMSLVDDVHQLIFMTSAKSGSASICRMHYEAIGNEDALKEIWVHNYRVKDAKRNGARLREVRGKYPSIKFVRNPYTRAISSYVRVLSNLDGWEESLRSKAFTTFETFLFWLENDRKNIATSHCDYQITDEEKNNKVTVIVKIEEIAGALIHINARFGTDYKYVHTSNLISRGHLPAGHHRKIGCDITYAGNTPYMARPPEKTIWQHNQRDWPANRAFLNKKTCDAIARIYKCDFCAYDYPVNLPDTEMSF